jgi:hypothetical protein
MNFARRNMRVISEPNYCLTELVRIWNYRIVRHNNPLALDEDTIIIVLYVPLAVIERMTVGFGTAIQPNFIAQRLKPGPQWVTRPLAGWIADEDKGSGK